MLLSPDNWRDLVYAATDDRLANEVEGKGK